MKVLIDEGLSTLQQLGGIGYFSYSLWKYLTKYIECDITDYRFLKAFPRAIKRIAYLGIANLEPYKQKYDIIHYQNYYIPRYLGKAKGVTTLHDFAGLTSPDVYPSWYNAYFKNVISKAIKRSDAITLSSYALKEELLGLFPSTNESYVHVCHHGVRQIFLESHPMATELALLNLEPYDYFLFVGNLEKRKNILFLLTQFIEARKQSCIAQDTKLILVGKIGNGYEEFCYHISERNNIFHLGRLSEERLVTLYKFCKAFVFPSIYEGYGVPILEAMSQKIPIVASNIPSSLEFNSRHNNHFFVFELGNKKTFINILSYLDKNYESITSRLDYGDLSIYSYDRVAQEHLKVYTKIL
jgi:glycosyltransferase involved in cell wall biosynthesis